MCSIRRRMWCPIVAIAMAVGWLAGTAVAQSPGTSAASSPADNSDGSSVEPEAARRTLFKRTPGIKWETDKDPKYEPWSGLTEEPTDPAKERRRSGLLDRLSRGWSGTKSSDAASADRASATAGSGAASRNAKAKAAGSPAQSTNPDAGPGTSRMPKTATAASFTTVQARRVCLRHQPRRPHPFSGAAFWRSSLGHCDQWCVRESGQSISGDGQQTLPLESLPQPPLPAPFTPAARRRTFRKLQLTPRLRMQPFV